MQSGRLDLGLLRIRSVKNDFLLLFQSFAHFLEAKRKMPTSCSAYNCQNRDTEDIRSRGITFHKFPKDESRRKSWIAATRRDGFKPNDKSAICSEHFTEGDFLTNTIRRTLSKTAAPTVFDFPDHLQKKTCEKRKAPTVRLEARRLELVSPFFRLRMEFDPPTSREQQRLTRLILSRRNSGADAEIRNSKFKMSSEMGGQDHENEERINKIEAEHQECLLVDMNDLVDYGTLDADGQKYMREMKTTRTLISIARDLLQGKKDEQQKRLEAEDKVKALEAKLKEFLRQDMTRNVKIWSQATQQFHDAEETLTTSTEYTPTFDHGTGSPRPSTSMEYTPTTPAEDIETDEGLRQVPQARISGKVVQAGRELYIQDRFGVSIPIIPTSSKKSSTNKRPSRPREDKSGRSPKKIKQEPKDYGDRINSDKSP